MADKTEQPIYLTEQTEDQIRQRMLEAMPPELDKTPGGFAYDAIEPAAIELMLVTIGLKEVLRRGFATTAAGKVPGEKTEWLRMRAEEHGVIPKPAVAAKGQITFTGNRDVVIPKGTKVSTASTQTSPSVVFETKSDAAVGADGTVTADIEAVTAGTSGNVAANKILLLEKSIDGITGLTNLSPTSGGLDEEDDVSLLDRYLKKVRSNSTGGNKADYETWALEVSGVGGVSVVPVKYGPGTVSIAVIDTARQPVGSGLVDKVQEYIAPVWKNEIDVESMIRGGHGVSIDDSDSTVKMVYDASGTGTLVNNVKTLLQRPGIWQARIILKADSTAESSDLLQVGIWNTSLDCLCKTTPTGNTDAVTTLKASDLATVFSEMIQEFYWNGVHNIELRITRLQADTSTTVWIEKAVCRSAFSRDTGEGKAPVGHRVVVEPADKVVIDITVKLVVAAGENEESRKAAVQQNIAAYLESIAYAKDNDVRYNKISQAILDTPGIADHQNLTVNGNSFNIPVGEQAVAMLGGITWL